MQIIDKILILFSLTAVSLLRAADFDAAFFEPDSNVVMETKQISFERFPDAHNPSIIQYDRGFLLTFRYCPDIAGQAWVSHVGIVVLDQDLNPISEPQLLNTRAKKSKTPSQAEDARIFSYRDRLFLIYNDNIDEICFDNWERRDMYIAELFFSDGMFTLSPPLRLYYKDKYHSQVRQKNWVTFEWNKMLYLTYSIQPHEVLSTSLREGDCYLAFQTKPKLNWPYGNPRGSAPCQLVDGQYLGFFHSSVRTRSPYSDDFKRWHYFMGAYTFEASPPFEVTAMSPKPIMGKDFYSPSYREKRVVFPGGYAVAGTYIYVAYGKDDVEIWIAKLDKEALKRSLIPVVKSAPVP